MDGYADLDAVALAALIRRGEVRAVEVVDAAIAAIESCNPVLNAVVTERFERARAEADEFAARGGPLAGVPFLLKDLACPMAGEPQHEGMRALRDAAVVATEDSFLVRRFRGAGLVVLGRTNTPELGLVPTTEPVSYGPTRNPWDITRTPGGSSGGAAAAVASGMVPVAHASDGGGSIRIPASACGLVGLKPSRARISIGPQTGELTRFLSVQLAVTRTVRDTATLLDVAAGAEVGDPVTAPPPSRPYTAEVGTDPGRLRIGLMTRLPGSDARADPDAVAAAEHAARLCERLGHVVEVSSPPALDDDSRASAFLTIWCVNTAYAVQSWSVALGRELGAADLEPLTWELVQRGRAVGATELLAATNLMQAWTRRMAQWWHDGFDLLLTPTLGEPPIELGVLADPDNPLAGYARAATFTPWTPFANQTGQPAMSLPLHWNDEGLPIGAHFVAPYGREDVLVRLAAQLEAAEPWADRRPPVHA
jgi:amidase